MYHILCQKCVIIMNVFYGPPKPLLKAVSVILPTVSVGKTTGDVALQARMPWTCVMSVWLTL